MEKEVTGLYLSGHPMDAYREAARAVGAVTIGSILSDFSREDGPARYRDGEQVTVAGVIGYEPQKSGRPAFSAAAQSPHAVATLPLIDR